jgi:DNA-binding NarL/FixJ family response regulator
MPDDSHAFLRKSFDGKELISSSHQVMKTAGATRHAERMTKVPVWALDDSKIAELIKLRFPKANSDPKQRFLAARMIRIIYLYYRNGATAGTIAEELKTTVSVVKHVIARVSRQMSSQEPLKPSHRPKIKGGPIQGTNGEQYDTAPTNSQFLRRKEWK